MKIEEIIIDDFLIEKYFNVLKEHEVFALKHRYGFYGEEKTYQQIGILLAKNKLRFDKKNNPINRERVRQIICTGLRKIKDSIWRENQKAKREL